MRYSIIILLTLFRFLSFAQESEAYLKYKKSLNYWDGYIIDKTGQKIDGLVKDQNEEKISYKVVFVTKDGKKKTFRPSQIQGYGYMVTKYVSNNEIFLEVVSEGKRIGVYKAIISRQSMMSINMGTQPTSGMVNTQSENYYFKKVNETTFEKFAVKELNSIQLQLFEKSRFKKKMTNYFSDCELLKSKISNDELTAKDYDKIAYHYNYDCK